MKFEISRDGALKRLDAFINSELVNYSFKISKFKNIKYKNKIFCILRNKKGLVVSPSQLSQKWFINKKTENLRKIKLLYVGRVKIEKGIFSLFEIIEKMNMNLTNLYNKRNF